jgi:hypothetical protein
VIVVELQWELNDVMTGLLKDHELVVLDEVIIVAVVDYYYNYCEIAAESNHCHCCYWRYKKDCSQHHMVVATMTMMMISNQNYTLQMTMLMQTRYD